MFVSNLLFIICGSEINQNQKIKTVAAGKEAYWAQESDRLGKQVVRTRTSLMDQ